MYAAVAFLLLGPTSILGQQTGVARASLPFAWPVTVGAVPEASRTPVATVGEFVRTVMHEDKTLFVPQFKFAVFEHGKIDLVAAVGRHAFGAIMVIRREDSGFRYWSFEHDSGEPLARDVSDLDGDGLAELVTWTWPMGYEGTESEPIYWCSVYKFRGGHPEDVGASFPQVYQGEMLPWLDYVERVFTGLDEEDRAAHLYDLDKVQYVKLKYRRQILGEKLAGLSEALGWAQSNRPAIQLLAVGTLKDIDDPRSVAELEKLVRSKNQGVCYGAVGGLGVLRHHDVTAADMAPCWQKRRIAGSQ